MIPRTHHLTAIRKLLNQFPVVCLIGARQVGKTTLARQLIEGEERSVTFFDLEDPTDEARLSDSKLALEPLRGLVIIDEVQRNEGLFRLLRVLSDRPGLPARFLVLGSAGPALLRQSSESLAGRIAYYELPPLRMNETGSDESNRLWLRGGFPPSFLADNDEDSHTWRTAFIRSFLERDLPQLGVSVPAASMRRFWTMLAHHHGNHWNGAELGRALGVTSPTVNTYFDTLVGAMVVRRMQPWYENLKKRQVKAPKVYISDPGLLHTLLGVKDESELMGHPKSGVSWEGFAMQEVVRITGTAWEDCYFWATHRGPELDLLVMEGGRRTGFEFKRTSAPSMTRSMHTALTDLKLDRLVVVFPGIARFRIHDRVEVVGLEQACEVGFD